MVYGMMVDFCWFDLVVDFNDRELGMCYLGDFKVVNESLVGFVCFIIVCSWFF